MVPLSTRNSEQRGVLAVFNNVATIMITGIIVALIFPMLILPKLGVDKSSWISMAVILSIIALPLTLLEYYHTKERVTCLLYTSVKSWRYSGKGRKEEKRIYGQTEGCR